MQHTRLAKSVLMLCTLVLGLAAAPETQMVSSVHAATYSELQERRPDLFHEKTGLRISRQRGPTPDDIPPPAELVSTSDVKKLLNEGAIAIDVFGAKQSRYDELDGTWLVSKTRYSLPNAIWLPETGRGVLEPEMEDYLAENLTDLTNGDRTIPLVVFCIADCWMSWNASQRIAGLGYESVYWYRLGTDGWEEEGLKLFPAEPVPVNVD